MLTATASKIKKIALSNIIFMLKVLSENEFIFCLNELIFQIH